MECSKLEELIEKIKRQTTLEENDIKSQLINNNYDYMKVIIDHFNIKPKADDRVVSVNQEIYKQIRNKMNVIMDEYQSKSEKAKKEEEMLKYKEMEKTMNLDEVD